MGETGCGAPCLTCIPCSDSNPPSHIHPEPQKVTLLEIQSLQMKLSKDEALRSEGGT